VGDDLDIRTGEGAAPAEHGTRLKRVGLVALMIVAGLNVWTGSPALALWVGARVQGGGPLTMGVVFAVVAVFAATALALGWFLSWLGATYDRMTGTAPTARQHVSWLRSMRGEREQYKDTPARLTALERVLVAMVVTAAVLFEIWFFFFSTSPIDNRSGRGALPYDPAPWTST
jgi:hypothetical protein